MDSFDDRRGTTPVAEGDRRTAGPLTDAFGTRLDPALLVEGLQSIGLRRFRLLARDDGIVLECEDPRPWQDDTARALTWLRSKFSPLVSIRAEKLHAAAPAFADVRSRGPLVVALAEVADGEMDLKQALGDLLQRLGRGDKEAQGRLKAPPLEEPGQQRLAMKLASLLDGCLPLHGWSPGEATLSVLAATRKGLEVVSGAGAATAPGPHFLLWRRPGGNQGVRPATLVAASASRPALQWLAAVLRDEPAALPAPDVLLDGLAWKASRRPAVAAPERADGLRIHVDAQRCNQCGVCAQMCPEKYLRPDGTPAVDDVSACTRCYECVDACPTDAIRPTAAPDTATLGSALAHRPGWLSRLAGLPGPSFPAPFPPSYLLPKAAHDGPYYVLGLAVMTMQEHAAALLRDGEIVGAIEHERLVRIRHAGWQPVNRPGVTAAVDPTILIEETFCRRPIRALLEREGILLDDIDVIAINGLHGRYADQISFIDGRLPLPSKRSGRVVYLPHHLCHAASAYRVSPAADAWVLTVDGRGDRECAAIWRAAAGELRLVDTLLSLTDCSIGGVYEGVSRLLGFGPHGQGSVMALAAFGTPRFDLGEFLSIAPDGTPHIHESRLTERFGHLTRAPDEPLTQEHKDLAASLQASLEDVALALLRRCCGEGPIDALALAGGVALNCRMNERLRRTLRPRVIFVQPGANDAGTALGAALEAWAGCGPAARIPMEHAYLGPEFEDSAIEKMLRRSGLKYERCEAIAREAARRLADGQVVCWFQGRLELGPRALGARSILADPRRAEMKDRVNAIKRREPWRPFGPSILAGHEDDWIDGAFDTRFMLFTVPVRPERRAEVPAIVHVDGTTRPQVVHAGSAPLYHALITEFHRLTGVPMVLNTSFNRRGEPIVCTPEDAIESFAGLGADALAIGSFLVEPERAVLSAVPSDAALAALGGGRRLALRLTTRCDLDCGHCSLRDQHGRPDRTFEEAVRALADGRAAGCDELVILRGEAALRDDLAALVSRARSMGYRRVQLQTNAGALAAQGRRRGLLEAGVSSFEVQLLAASEELHDELAATAGSFRQTLIGTRALAEAGAEILATVPVLVRNQRHLGAVATLAHRLGIRRIQFNFPRPVELADRVLTAYVPRLSLAAHYLRQAAAVARGLGMSVSTEAFPFCHLPPELRNTPEAREDWRRHRVDDLHLLHEELAATRRTQRPAPPPCRACAARETCPKTWALYLELFGSGELRPLP